MKKWLLALLLLLMTGCSPAKPADPEIVVFAASSLTEALDQAIADYKSVAPEITVIPTYDSSGTLKTQIESGAACDLFISASPAQMDALEAAGFLSEDTRVNLLQNQIVLAVPAGNPAGITSFDQLANLLQTGDVFLAIGNNDVPAGQYARKIFDFYGIVETDISPKLTYGSNVKEVTTQISEATVDCGIIYSTDAFSAGVAAVDSASAEMCGQVLYPAAILSDSSNSSAASAFLNYLASTDGGMLAFAQVGFSPAN